MYTDNVQNIFQDQETTSKRVNHFDQIIINVIILCSTFQTVLLIHT